MASGMSFSFSAAGTRDETLSSLRSYTRAQLGDGLGREVRDMLVRHLEDSEGRADLRYEVSAAGHSSQGGLLTCNVSVRADYVRDRNT
jgi:hypothetical protein